DHSSSIIWQEYMENAAGEAQNQEQWKPAAYPSTVSQDGGGRRRRRRKLAARQPDGRVDLREKVVRDSERDGRQREGRRAVGQSSLEPLSAASSSKGEGEGRAGGRDWPSPGDRQRDEKVEGLCISSCTVYRAVIWERPPGPRSRGLQPNAPPAMV
ncbi:hypothetical protein H112_01277, partial [Trichophyton rubrum D6]